MTHLSRNSIIRAITALVLTLCMVVCGGCVSITIREKPTQPSAQPGTTAPPVPVVTAPAPTAQNTQDNWYETFPSQAPTTQPATEPTLPPAEVDYEIDWDNKVVLEDDPNVLTQEEFEELVEQNPQMADIMELIGPYIDIFGFAYDPKQDIFYSTKYPIQRIFGYNTLYDAGASRFGLFYLTQRIRFTYDGKEWMVQLWKGQYGATVGGEVGLYYRDASKFIRHYETVEDEDMVIMGFQLCKNGKPYLERGPERHWWLTGFRILDVAVATQLHMVIYFDWENPDMATAFELGLNKMLLTDVTYVRDGTRFWLTWTL